MTRRLSRILDGSALVALFEAHEPMMRLYRQAEAGLTNLYLPAVCVADAEQQLGAGTSGWEAILLAAGVVPMPLSESAAIDVGSWPGSLSARHAVYEANLLRGVVVTTEPGGYRGLPVALRVV